MQPDNGSNEPRRSTRQEVLYRIIEASYLRPLGGAAKKHTKRGQLLENVIATSALNDQDKEAATGRNMPKRLTVCSAGLIHKKDQPYIKDSIDYLRLALNRNGHDTDLIVHTATLPQSDSLFRLRCWAASRWF